MFTRRLLLNDDELFPIVGDGPDPPGDRLEVRIGPIGVLMSPGQQVPEPRKAHRRPEAQGGSRLVDLASDDELRYLRGRLVSSILDGRRLVQEPLLLLPRSRGQRGQWLGTLTGGIVELDVMRSLMLCRLLRSVVGLRRRLIVPRDLLIVSLSYMSPLDRAEPVRARPVPRGRVSGEGRSGTVRISFVRRRFGRHVDRSDGALTSRGADPSLSGGPGPQDQVLIGLTRLLQDVIRRIVRRGRARRISSRKRWWRDNGGHQQPLSRCRRSHGHGP